MHRRNLCAIAIPAVFLFAVFTMGWAQQDKSQRPSPPGSADCTINGKKVSITYSRPFLKGRHVGQELAPYGKVWRTGANEATTLTTAVDLNIGGARVPAGTYLVHLAVRGHLEADHQ
jgi:hypothetical protein